MENIKSTFKKKQENVEKLTVEYLYDCFESMFGEIQAINMQDDMSDFDFEQKSICEELDYEFTEHELGRAMFSQKDNKSPEIDSISIEILKTSYDFISPRLLKLYNNRMFNMGGGGENTPILKSVM